MITGLIEFVMGGALQLVLLLLALLPAVDLSALPLAMPQGVADVLGRSTGSCPSATSLPYSPLGLALCLRSTWPWSSSASFRPSRGVDP